MCPFPTSTTLGKYDYTSRICLTKFSVLSPIQASTSRHSIYCTYKWQFVTVCDEAPLTFVFRSRPRRVNQPTSFFLQDLSATYYYRRRKGPRQLGIASLVPCNSNALCEVQWDEGRSCQFSTRKRSGSEQHALSRFIFLVLFCPFFLSAKRVRSTTYGWFFCARSIRRKMGVLDFLPSSFLPPATPSWEDRSLNSGKKKR